MKVLKKFITVLCSATMIVSASATAFAADPETTAGTGNILAYHYDSVIVPTAFKVALNPAGYTVTVRPDSQGDDKTTTDQIVTFNYGIGNLSTGDKVVNVSLGVTGETGTGTAITFVDAIAEAQAYDADSNENGAKPGELKMYLELAAASDLPTTAADAAFAIVDEATGTKNTTNVSGTTLTDVKMAAASSGKVVFKPATGKYAAAEVAFSLGNATYDVQDGVSIDFTTTQSALSEKMEITHVGDVTGFTIAGAMNPNADWTTADVSSLAFAPVYEVTDATGAEVAEGGYKQIKTTPATYTVTYNANYAEADPATKTETVNAGAAPTGEGMTFTRDGYTQDGWLDAAEGDAVDLSTIDAATTVYAKWVENATDDYVMTVSGGVCSYTFVDTPEGTLTAITVDGSDRSGGITAGNVTYVNGVLTFNATATTNMGLATGNHTIVATIGGQEITLTVAN